MKFPLIGSVCAAAALAAALAAAAPGRAGGAPWPAGKFVEAAAQGFDVTMVLGKRPLLGYLTQPQAPGRHPAVILLHGCAGFGAADTAVADGLGSFGYVALALDSLADFNACGNGVNGALAEAFDAYQGLDWLARQGFVDPGRVAVLGFSMGGGAALAAVEQGLIENGKKHRFGAAIAYYPSCRHRTGVMSAPTLILIGDDDDWSSASRCRDMVAGRDERGSPVKLIVYPKAGHAFNIPLPPRRYLGHRLEYDPKAAADAWQQVRGFLHGVFARSGG